MMKSFTNIGNIYSTQILYHVMAEYWLYKWSVWK